jgi:hypothetical protein
MCRASKVTQSDLHCLPNGRTVAFAIKVAEAGHPAIAAVSIESCHVEIHHPVSVNLTTS